MNYFFLILWIRLWLLRKNCVCLSKNCTIDFFSYLIFFQKLKSEFLLYCKNEILLSFALWKNWGSEFLQILIEEFLQSIFFIFLGESRHLFNRVHHSWSIPSGSLSFQSPSLLPFVHQVPSGVHQMSVKCYHLSIRMIMCSI